MGPAGPARRDERAGFCVADVRALKRRSRAEEARELLEKVAKQVQPLMRRRGWVCPSLVEFEPRSPNLLGLNVGGGGGRTRQIKVRVRRPPGPSDDFLPYEDILGTLLHELVHNVRGPHDAMFYAILDEITSECERDIAAGVAGTGQGFDAPAAGRVGGRGPLPANNMERSKLREAMARAAEKRCQCQTLMPSGGQQLGGDSAAAAGLTPAQAAARAAERRLKDDLWCPASGMAGPDGQVVELNSEAEDTEAQAQRPPGVAPSEEAGFAAAPDAGPSGLASVEIINLSSSDEEGAGRGAQLPPGKRQRTQGREGSGGSGSGGGGRGQSGRGWSCRQCTLLNPPQATHCAACGAWAFTHGPPVGASPRHFST